MSAGLPGLPGEHGTSGGAGGRGGGGGQGGAGDPVGPGGRGGAGGAGGQGEKGDRGARGPRGYADRIRGQWLVYLCCFIAIGYTWVAAHDAVDKIQGERARNVQDNCEQVNQRHDNTIVALDGVLDQARKTAGPAQRKQIQQSRAATVLLIDALAPKRDCNALVRRQVGG
jgi:hypothetical protein